LGKVEVCIDSEIPFGLPNSWAWIRLSSVLTSTDASKSPQCKDRPRSQGEWGVIKTTAIQDAQFLENENKVLPEGFDVPIHSRICSGDLLITRAGPRNRTRIMCVVDYQPENLMLSDKTVRLSYFREYVDPYYIMAALQSPAMQYGMTASMSGMAESQVNISQDKMKRFLLPLPPLAEQHRIVDQIKAILPMVKSL
jgi:type-1 restriction enzyme ecoEI specificity protein